MDTFSALLMLGSTIFGVISIPVVLLLVLYQLLFRRTKSWRWYATTISIPGVCLGIGMLTFFLRGMSPILEGEPGWVEAGSEWKKEQNGEVVNYHKERTRVSFDGESVSTESESTNTEKPTTPSRTEQ